MASFDCKINMWQFLKLTGTRNWEIKGLDRTHDEVASVVVHLNVAILESHQQYLAAG